MPFNVKEAYDYYKKFVRNEERFQLLEKHNFKLAGCVPSVDWELFGSILTGDQGKDGYGSDLGKHEVKSAVEHASFEYQYHLNAGEHKLNEDMVVDHIFNSYSPD